MSEIPSLQSEFIAQMADPLAIRSAFDHLPGVLLSIRDRQHRMIACNRKVASWFGVESEEEVIGKNIADYLPRKIFEEVTGTDGQVYETGKAILGHVQLVFNQHNPLEWLVVHKLPIFGNDGDVIGVMSIGHAQSPEAARNLPVEFSRVAKAIELVRQNLDRRVSVNEMAQAAGMSAAQLRRDFRQALGMSPHDFESATRLRAACEELETSNKPIGEIALDFGFCDQSAFTVQFGNYLGCTPTEYRKKRSGTAN